MKAATLQSIKTRALLNGLVNIPLKGVVSQQARCLSKFLTKGRYVLAMCTAFRQTIRRHDNLLSLTYKVLTTSQPDDLHNLISSVYTQNPRLICCYPYLPHYKSPTLF